MASCQEKSQKTTIIFDLDNTLFDHVHSCHSALLAIQDQYPHLTTFSVSQLRQTYNACLHQSYDEFLRKEIGYHEKEIKTVRRFFASTGLHRPFMQEVRSFRKTYREAYQADQRTTPRVIETLCMLRDRGYQIVVLTNGPTEGQRNKAAAIGVLPFVHHFITSEDANAAKPQKQAFEHALMVAGASKEKTWMVGSDFETDVEGALKAGLRAMYFDPESDGAARKVDGKEVPVIHRFGQIPGLLKVLEEIEEARVPTRSWID